MNVSRMESLRQQWQTGSHTKVLEFNSRQRQYAICFYSLGSNQPIEVST